MKLLHSTTTTISPDILVKQGEVWVDLYNKAISSGNTYAILPAAYCLFSAAEMYIKAYIVLKHPEYSKPEKLQTLGHKFNLMYDKFHTASNSAGLSKKLKDILNKYQLFSLDINKLKYKEMSQTWLIDRGIEKGKHDFESFFREIEKEVTSELNNWLNDTFPRKEQVVIFLQFDSEIKSATHKQVEKWIKLCPLCRPKGVLMSLNINYPWCLDDQPISFCTKCKAPYRQDKDIDPYFYSKLNPGTQNIFVK